MKIGEFARLCGTKITVLRHYDKEKLLVPENIDKISGYRYYSSEQILNFHRITALKKAGFSLQEIKDIISSEKSNDEMMEIFSRKEKEFLSALENLKEAKLMMTKLNIEFSNDSAVIKLTNDSSVLDLCTLAETEIKAADYQRVSQYCVNGDNITCEVVKLGKERKIPEERLPFVNDEKVIGKWEILGIYAVKEDFYDNLFCVRNFYGGEQKFLYFLPEGERYWSYSWTKGFLNSPVNNEYETEIIDNELYMFINLKEYEYTRGGKTTCLVLKKFDSNRYSAEEIARKDDINRPFVNDERIIGKWKAHSFLSESWDKKDFDVTPESIEELYFKEVEFFPEGSCRLVYEDDIFESDDKAVWTAGFLLRKWNWSACEYEIRTVDGKDYMIIEWKSGDWRYGGYDTNYYVFTKSD